MKVVIACDHAGLPLKSRLKEVIVACRLELLDCGVHDDQPADYPDVAREVGDAILKREAERGVVICGSGVGIAMAANKIPGIRAGLCHDCYSARQGVEHDAMNVLCLGARVAGPELAAEIVRIFLQARFSGAERHVRRLSKIAALEGDARAGRFDSGLDWQPTTES